MTRHASIEIPDAIHLAYRRGELTQEEAAKLCGRRKATFAAEAQEWALDFLETALSESSADPWVRKRVRNILWRAYLRRFMASFPECDARCAQPEIKRMELTLWKECEDAPVRHYSAAEAATLPPSQTRMRSGTHLRYP